MVSNGMLWLLSFLLYLVPTQFAPRLGCTISINKDITEPQPLILRPEGGDGNDAYYLPSNGDTITLSESQSVDLACPGSNLLLDGSSTGSEIERAQCSSSFFSVGSRTLPLSAITCSVIPQRSIRYTGRSCLSNYQEAEIGFPLSTRFLTNLLICYDPNLQHTLYSEYNLTKTIAGFQKRYPRPRWSQGSGFYSVGSTDVNTLYTRNRQRITINALLGLDSSDYKYIAESSELYLSRGHLTAKADFLYGAQHRLTFYFLNVAPQWQTFNGENWKYLEVNVRGFASSRNLDLIVYTGTYGVCTLPHEATGQNIELYLYVDGTARGIPVPRLFWKVLYEPITKAGVVFIGVNNPYVLNRSTDIICTDICSQYDWLTWRASNVTLGYGYCCSVDDFRKTVTTLPDFEVRRLLMQSSDACIVQCNYLHIFVTLSIIVFIYDRAQ